MDIERLRDAGPFKDLPQTVLTNIVAVMRNREFLRGEILFSEGEPGQGIWIVHKGTVKLVKTDALGREQLLKIVSPYEVFAEVVFFDDGPYPATAVAADNGRAMVLYNRDAEALISEHPSVAWHLLRVLSRRLRLAQERIRILSAADVTQKLAATLLHLSEQQNSPSLSLSHQDLANMLGTTRETVSRVLGSMASDGSVALGRNRVLIKSRQNLDEMANR
jgi:CRP/FNR family transcriptional regulator